ncbi:dipeptidyl peptidase III [Penicillium malachiteum]|uniref:Dipeptidyl peptidase III n=1 Tax=Penicillium malachiteum TaxID=1324776 RepID=A0AAD6HNM6_9EURO|nr:dipeptidyl peptidase III [Penicillium malachiteum]
MLPWAIPGENDGKGPFQANLFQAPDFTIVHSLAFCTSYVWEAVNLPNYSDIKEATGFKNIVFANRQTWTSLFEKLASSVEECRAMLASYYLAENKELLAMFVYNDTSIITADDIIYFTYLHIGVEGVKALRAFNVEDQTWGQPHARANFAILKHLLLDGHGVMKVGHDAPSLGRMLCRIHVWRWIADLNSCSEVYERLGAVDGNYEAWRRIVASKQESNWKSVQPNTILRDGEVELRIYEESNEEIIQSFAERAI